VIFSCIESNKGANVNNLVIAGQPLTIQPVHQQGKQQESLFITKREKCNCCIKEMTGI